MGAYGTFIDAIKSSLAGVLRIGGVLTVTADDHPIALAQEVRGAFCTLPTLEDLADMPLSVLQLDMEVVVSQYTKPDTTLHSRSRYRLKAMPPSRVSEIPSYVITDYWEVVPGSSPGAAGANGWTPVVANEADGANRVVQKVVDYIGGTGTKPSIPTDSYLGPSGFTSKSLAVNVKGSTGPAGTNATSRPEYYVYTGSRAINPPNNTWTTAQYQYLYLTGSLQLTNTHSADRMFLIQGEVPVSNDNGSDAWSVRLLRKNSNAWGSNPSNEPMIDQNYSRMDYVNAGSKSVHKVKVQSVVSLSPNQSIYLRLAMAQMDGGGSYFEDGFIEIIGL